MDQSKTNEIVQSISAAVTAQVIEKLKAAGLLPKPTDASNKAAQHLQQVLQPPKMRVHTMAEYKWIIDRTKLKVQN